MMQLIKFVLKIVPRIPAININAILVKMYRRNVALNV